MLVFILLRQQETVLSRVIGLDIGGTKMAGVVLDDSGSEISESLKVTPQSYDEFLTLCSSMVDQLRTHTDAAAPVGIAIPGIMDRITGLTRFVSNIGYLSNKPLRNDLERILKTTVHIANDANCAALSEATDGAGRGHHSVFGLVLGTGVGAGLVINQHIYEGCHGIAGEFGHLPLPYRSDEDGPIVSCNCGQNGCIDKTISGPGLERLHYARTGQKLTTHQIVSQAFDQEGGALGTLDRFYTMIAKAMVTVIHAYDPDVIVVSGGLNALPGLYEAVPQKWVSLVLMSPLNTRFVPAVHGALSGRRGAALLCKSL